MICLVSNIYKEECKKLLVAQWFEHWQLKLETLCSIPDEIWHFTFLLFPTLNVCSSKH